MSIRHASIRNRLLALLSVDDFNLLATHLEAIDLPTGQVLIEADQMVAHAYFLEAGITSVVTKLEPTIEIGIYGSEGMGGSTLVMGIDQEPHKHFMQIGGGGWRIDAGAMMAAVDASQTLRMFLLRYVHVFAIQMSLTAVSNATDKIEERLARWLLMCHDRLDSDDVTLTHSFLSTMLGVRRPGVTDAIHRLEGQRLIKGHRGRITIQSRKGLEAVAGDSYGLPEAEYVRLIGPAR
jgi:CRP-like cAMP-binding protein